MNVEIVLTVLVVIAGLYMAWSIGANDVANAMGTSVGSGALTLKQAVIIAAVLEFCGAFFFGTNVTETVQGGIVNTDLLGNDWKTLVCGMLSALIAAGAWLQLASYYGWPVSTTHSIVGAVVGFGLIAAGFDAIQWENVGFIVMSWILSPLMGGILAYLIFNFLRKSIFYAQSPLAQARHFAPALTFLVVVVMSLIVSNGIHLDWPLGVTIAICLSLGLLSAGAAHLYLKTILSHNATTAPTQPPASELSLELSKVIKHLQRVEQSSDLEVRYHTKLLLEDVEHLRDSLQKTAAPLHSEYEAVEKLFAFLQTLSACLMAFAHGANDVANAIGPLSAALSALAHQSITATAPIPAWTLALGGFGIVVGLATWGWRVIDTIGKKITELTPSRGFAAEFGAAATILLATRFGLPISTTHTLVGAVLGVGLARGLEALDLSTTRDIVISWVVTVPAGALLSITLYWILCNSLTAL